MKYLLLLTLSIPAYAALPPAPSAPVVKRAAPLLSPKHASALKAAPMLRTVPITEPPRLPMQAFHQRVQSEYGTDEFTAQALQPASQSVLFEMSTDMAAGSWVGLAYFPPYVAEQPVFAGITTYEPRMVIRATATPVMPTGMVRLSTTGPAIWVNPAVRGAFARRGK